MGWGGAGRGTQSSFGDCNNNPGKKVWWSELEGYDGYTVKNLDKMLRGKIK